MQAITKVHSPYGAPMGRRETGTVAPVTAKLFLRRVRLNNGGYDDGGAYWGIGQPLYQFGDDDGVIDQFIRADNREHAKSKIFAKYPQATFAR